MILAIDKHAALYVFSSSEEAERELEAIDVQQDEFEFCDLAGQRYAVVYTIPPKVSRFGPLQTIDIGAFKLSAQGSSDPTVSLGIVDRATHIERTSVPAFTSLEALRNEIRKSA